MRNISVIILAGGLATRMKPITESIPKSLIKVNGRAFIDYQIDLLEKNEVRHIVISTGYLGDMLEKHLNMLGAKTKIEFSPDGSKPLGTGGAIVKALPLLSESFIVLYGDSYLNVELKPIVKKYLEAEQNLDGLMTIYKNNNNLDSSNVIYRDNKIIKYSKNENLPDMNYIDWGLSILNKRAFKNFNNLTSFDLSEVFIDLINQESLLPYEVYHRFYEIGSKKGLEELSSYLEK